MTTSNFFEKKMFNAFSQLMELNFQPKYIKTFRGLFNKAVIKPTHLTSQTNITFHLYSSQNYEKKNISFKLLYFVHCSFDK